jgi:hypothetical protein
VAEWYEDVDGHRSGTTEKNRPGWLALKQRLGDADVAALIANDLSRLHRKGWRVGDLLELVDQHEVKLVLAAPGKQLDFTSLNGRVMAQLIAIFDEYYAADIAARAKDSIAFRKKKGITVGLPPFGTRRGENGYLQPSTEGAWYLPDGTFQVGVIDHVPDEGAVWRSYYGAAKRVLEMYAENNGGLDTIAYRIQTEGRAYRDCKGNPVHFESDDIRRIIANWTEYGGCVSEKRARERHLYDYDLDQITLDPERTVFPLELLYKVGAIRKERTIRRSAKHGVKTTNYPYALNGIVYCARCEQLAAQSNDAALRSRLIGMWHDRGTRYRHKPGLQCGCVNRSVRGDLIEGEFGRLLHLLTVRADQIPLMNE